MCTGYNLGRDKNSPVATEIGFTKKKKKRVVTVFEGGRNTVFVAIYFSFKKNLS